MDFKRPFDTETYSKERKNHRKSSLNDKLIWTNVGKNQAHIFLRYVNFPREMSI